MVMRRAAGVVAVFAVVATACGDTESPRAWVEVHESSGQAFDATIWLPDEEAASIRVWDGFIGAPLLGTWLDCSQPSDLCGSHTQDDFPMPGDGWGMDVVLRGAEIDVRVWSKGDTLGHLDYNLVVLTDADRRLLYSRVE